MREGRDATWCHDRLDRTDRPDRTGRVDEIGTGCQVLQDWWVQQQAGQPQGEPDERLLPGGPHGEIVGGGGGTVTTAPVPSTPRAVWIGFALVFGVLIGAAAGLLSAAGGVPVPLAIVAGGSAAAVAVGLFITLVRYATADGS